MKQLNFKFIRIALGFVLVVGVIVSYQNCGQSGFKVAKDIYSLDNPTLPTCNIQFNNPVVPTNVQNQEHALGVPENKLDLNSFGQNRTMTSTLPQGTEIMVEVNNNCLKERTGSASIFTQSLVAKKKYRNVDPSDVYSVNLPSPMSFQDIQDIASSDSCIISVFKKMTVQSLLSTPPPVNDPDYNQQTSLPVMQFAEAYNFFFSPIGIQEDVIVADLSSVGFDTTHPDLIPSFWINRLEIPGNNIDDDGNGLVDDVNGFDFSTNSGQFTPATGHDTLILGMLAAATNNNEGIAAPIAKHGKLMLLNGTNNVQVGLAIRYAADNGAKFLTMSFIIAQSDYLLSSIQYAISKGVTIFAAAGNSGPDNGGTGAVQSFAQYGQTIPGFIAVAATDAATATLGNICGLSSFDASYVLGAPGCTATVGFYSTASPILNGVLYRMSNGGTSFASPHATAVAAVAYAYVRDRYQCELSPAQVENLLFEGSRHYSALDAFTKNGMTVNMLSLKNAITNHFGNGAPVNQ